MAEPEQVDYPVKRGHRAKTDLGEVMEDAFGSVKQDGDWFESSYELIRSVRARYEKKSTLYVINDQKGLDEIDLQNDMDAVKATQKAWNQFLNEATGYTAKQRRKKAQDAAKKGK